MTVAIAATTAAHASKNDTDCELILIGAACGGEEAALLGAEGLIAERAAAAAAEAVTEADEECALPFPLLPRLRL